MGRVRKGRSSRDKGLPKGRGGASVTVAEQMSGEGSEQRSGPAEAIVARRSSRPEMPGWLLKEGADEEDESGSEYDPARSCQNRTRRFNSCTKHLRITHRRCPLKRKLGGK